jgi:uncharacterized membrane protein YkvA (DUF1232 family)
MRNRAKHMETTEAAGRALAPYDPERFERDRNEVEDGFWRKVRRVASYVPFVEDAIAAYYCARDRATPIQAKAVIMGALAYFVIPLDVIPDFLTGLGFTDDATVFYIAYQTISKHVTERHREKAREALARLRGEDSRGAP